MKQKIFIPTFLGLILSLWPMSADAAIQNHLANPGFESDLGGARNWDNTANRGIVIVAAGAPEGSRFLRLDEATLAVGTAGAFTFQTVTPAAPGDRISFSALARANTLDGGDAGQLVIEYQNAAGTTIAQSIAAVAAVSGTFARISTSATAPAGTAQITYTIRIQPSAVGGTSQVDFDDVKGTINSAPLWLEATPVSSKVKPGDLNVIAVKVQNTTAVNMSAVQIVANPAPGVDIFPEAATFSGQSVGQLQGSVIFPIGHLTPGQEGNLVFFVGLTSAVVPGKSYEITLVGRTPLSGTLSETVHILIIAEPDPVFDEGTIIGKVFQDENRNTVQDRGEKGIPWVRLITEEGIVVITDKDGKYHIPGVVPGRHVVKIDAHTLPQGTEFITEESYLVKITQGMMAKVNFAVRVLPSAIPLEFREDLEVTLTQGLDTSQPKLHIKMEPEVLRAGLGVLEKEAAFQIEMNYPEFVKHWYLEIRDELGREVWTGFGVSAPPSDLVWNGAAENGLLVKPGIYSYRFRVRDKDGNEDWTTQHFFRVVSKADASWDESVPEILPTVGEFNIFKDGKQTIPLVAKPTVRVQGRTKPGNKITVNNFPVEVTSDGTFQTEMYVSPGDKQVVVTSTNPEGESTSYTEKITVKDSTFFMAALGEEQLGVNFANGNLESAADDDPFKDHFYEDGRLSYYLRGKIKGKFLIKSHYDTSNKRSALFTNLDPDEYYPIYGDASTRDYEAQDTRDRFFFTVEMDRSFAKWGSFKTEFTDTELASYNRTLSGLKIHHETKSTTPYGDPLRGFKLFWSKDRHKADHNEFAATGGSLYYLRHRGVIEGSEKIRVETRDKIQGITVKSYDLTEGRDYEIDYSEGRLMLSRPLSSVAASDTLFSNDVLDGNPVYLIVDYEYDAGPSILEDTNRGVRGYTHIGNHLKIGATAVEEKRGASDYDLRGVDATIKLGRNTKVTAEYATSIQQQTGQGVSFNGGLSFANLGQLHGLKTKPREDAYLIKGESQPLKNVEVSGYVQGIEPSFSNDHTSSHEGTKKYGLATRYKFTDNFYTRYRFDSTEVSDQLMPLREHGVSSAFNDYQTNTIQAVYDNKKYLGEAEYIHQRADVPLDNLQPSLLSEAPFDHGMAIKLGYYLNDRLLPYVKFQSAFDEKSGQRFGGGVRYEVVDKLYAYMEELMGSLGDSTLFGVERHHENGARSYANLRMLDRGAGEKAMATTVGSSYSLTPHSRIYSEKQYSSYQSEDGYADILGVSGNPGDHWDYDARFERRHLDNSATRLLDDVAAASLARTNSFNTITTSLGYASGEKFRARTSFEVRIDDDNPEILQIMTRDSVEYKIHQDLSLLGKLDFGKSRFVNPDDTAANFLEASTGFAYRPVDFDKLNVLTRYTYLRNSGSDLQFSQTPFVGVEVDEASHLFAIDVNYDIFKYVSLVEKLAYKTAILDTNLSESVTLNQLLSAHRLNFHVTRKWDIALEYRLLWQSDALDTLKQGMLAEIDRELYDYVRIGAGYNFTDFDDDLRSASNYDSQGPFVRLTGKF